MPGPVLTSQLLLPFGNTWLPPGVKSYTAVTHVPPAHGIRQYLILQALEWKGERLAGCREEGKGKNTAVYFRTKRKALKSVHMGLSQLEF